MLDPPFSELILLLAATTLVRLILFRLAPPPTAAGAAVMALGIFCLGALQHLPVPWPGVSRLATIELLIIWAYVALGFLASFFRGAISSHTADPVGCFAIGTWVAGTAVVAVLIDSFLPGWRLLALPLAALATIILVAYLRLILRCYRAIIAVPHCRRVTGRILLSTVAIQAAVVLATSLFPTRLPQWLLVWPILLGYLCYGIGLLLIGRRYLRRGWRLANDWDNTNCILHGALSISGLAGIHSGALPGALIILTWVAALLLFVLVELLELARLYVRVRAYGWRRGIFSYNVSQWARNFTFGMFFIFTLQLLGSPATSMASLPPLTTVAHLVVDWGQYVVLLLLLIEIALFFMDAITSTRRLSASASLLEH